MEGVLNTSGQSAYHSCRQSFENVGVVQNDVVDQQDTPVILPNVSPGDGDSTFVCQKEDTSVVLSPSSADVSDLGALIQSNVIAESTRTSIQMNGSGFGNGSGDDSVCYDQPGPILLTQKLTGGMNHNANSTSTPCDSSNNGEPLHGTTNGAGGGNPALNDCLINSALGCSATNNSGEIDNMLSTTPLRSKQVEEEQLIALDQEVDEHDDLNGNDNDNNDNNNDNNEGEDDILIDENVGGVRQNRSGSFTVVREKAIPGTPIIEDEPVTVDTHVEDVNLMRNGSATPPSRSPGLMQDSASRPLIPKAKNRKSVWVNDVFSPVALNNGGGQEPEESAAVENSDQILLLPISAATTSNNNNNNNNSNFTTISPLICANNNNNNNISPALSSKSTSSSVSSSSTYSRSTGSKMLLEAISTGASVGLSCDATSIPLGVNNNNNGIEELSFANNNNNNGGRASSNGSSSNHSYEIANGSEENGGIVPVVDAGNVSAALMAGRTSSSSLNNNHRGVTPPEDGLVGGGKLEFMNVGSSATITKSKPTPVRHQSPGVSALPPHMMSPAVSNNICPPMPPASSSPKQHLIAGNGNGNGTTNALAMSPLDGKAEPHVLCTTPILPAVTNGNGCVQQLVEADADRSDLLARISQLELENSTLKSKYVKFEGITNQLVVKCSNHFSSAPSPSDLEEFHKFVSTRLLAAEEVSDDYRSLEGSFNELHRRYERARTVIAESQARDRQLQADLATMKQAAAVADQRVTTLMRDFEAKLGELEAKNAALEETLQTEQLKSELRVGQMEIEARNLQQQLQQKDNQIGDLNRLLANAMASTARRG